MDVLRGVLLIVHVVAVLALLVGLLLQARSPERRITGFVRDGAGTALVSGLALAAVEAAGDDPVGYPKIAVKLLLGVVILVLVMTNLRRPSIPAGLWGLLLALTLGTTGIAVVW